MSTISYMNQVKKHLNIDSDYALAKALGVTKQTVSRYSQGKSHFDDTVAERVAAILKIHPGIVVLDAHRERAKTPQEQALWSGIMEKFSASFNSLMLRANPRRNYVSTR